MRATFANKEFPWWEQLYGDDDFVCYIADYILRVEQMRKGYWWWRVYYKGEAISVHTNEYASTKFRAIGQCEGLYMGHKLLT